MKAKNKPTKSQRQEVAAYNFRSSGKVAVEVMRRIEQAYSHTAPAAPESLLPDPGFVPGKFTVVCSMPAVGKTAYLVNLALELQDQGKNMAIFLPDYTAEDFFFRTVSVRSKINFSGMRMGRMHREAWPAITRAAGAAAAPGLYVSKRPVMTEAEIFSDARGLAKALELTGQSLDAVLIDSMNYLAEEEFCDYTFSGLHRLARELKVGVIGTFGLHENKKIKEGWVTLADARAAGINEQETDAVLNLRRPEYYDRTDPTLKGMAELHPLYSADGWGRAHFLNYDYATLTFSQRKVELPDITAIEEELF